MCGCLARGRDLAERFELCQIFINLVDLELLERETKRPLPAQKRRFKTQKKPPDESWRFGAENETRTRDPDLGKVVLYQLSYFRSISKTRSRGTGLQRYGKNLKLQIIFSFFRFRDFAWNDGGEWRVGNKCAGRGGFTHFRVKLVKICANKPVLHIFWLSGQRRIRQEAYPINFAISRARRSLRGSTWNWPTEASTWGPPTPLSSVRKT